jgi:hypothetical protein
MYGDRPVSALKPAFSDRDALSVCIKKDVLNPGRVVQTGKGPKPVLDPWFTPEMIGDFPLFGHCDLGHKKDACGLALSCMPGTIPVDHGDGTKVQLPVVRVVVMWRILANPGEEIRFAAVRSVLYDMQDRGFDLSLITFDGWQSIDSIQELNDRNIPSCTMSVDATRNFPVFKQKSLGAGSKGATIAEISRVSTDGRLNAVMQDYFGAVIDTRVFIPTYPEAIFNGFEWLELEMFDLENEGGKVRKNPNGTDDLVQAVAASVFNTLNNADPPDIELTDSRAPRARKDEKLDVDRQPGETFVAALRRKHAEVNEAGSGEPDDLDGDMFAPGRYSDDLDGDDDFGIGGD